MRIGKSAAGLAVVLVAALTATAADARDQHRYRDRDSAYGNQVNQSMSGVAAAARERYNRRMRQLERGGRTPSGGGDYRSRLQDSSNPDTYRPAGRSNVICYYSSRQCYEGSNFSQAWTTLEFGNRDVRRRNTRDRRDRDSLRDVWGRSYRPRGDRDALCYPEVRQCYRDDRYSARLTHREFGYDRRR